MSKIITRRERQEGRKCPSEILCEVGGEREEGKGGRQSGRHNKDLCLVQRWKHKFNAPQCGQGNSSNREVAEEATATTTRINTGRSHSESIKAKSLSPSKNSRRFVSLFRLKVFNVVAVAWYGNFCGSQTFCGQQTDTARKRARGGEREREGDSSVCVCVASVFSRKW